MDKVMLLECTSKSDVCRKMNITNNGVGMEVVNKLLIKYNLPTTYFTKNSYDENNPPFCLHCGVIIPKNKKRNNFCNNSCAAIYNNTKRIRNDKKEEKYCLICDKKIGYYNIFCGSTCYAEHNRRKIFESIENNTLKLNTPITEGKYLKKYLIKKYGEKCMKCGWDEEHTITGIVPIQLNHIDGNSENNKLDNVELVCPNCHSLTPNYGFLNKGNGRTKRREYREKQKKEKGYSI